MAKITLFEFEDSNIAGDEWKWTFYLNRTANGRFTVSCRQVVNCGTSQQIDAIRGLVDGVDIHAALVQQLEEATCTPDSSDWELAAEAIACIDLHLAERFRRAPELIEAQEAAEHARAELERTARLEPVRAKIEAYVQRVDDTPLRYLGATRRQMFRRFIEGYFLQHGYLPTGTHWVQVSVWNGGEHNFDFENA